MFVVNTAAADAGAVGDDQREVELRRIGLDAAGHAGGAKAGRRGDAAFEWS